MGLTISAGLHFLLKVLVSHRTSITFVYFSLNLSFVSSTNRTPPEDLGGQRVPLYSETGSNAQLTVNTGDGLAGRKEGRKG